MFLHRPSKSMMMLMRVGLGSLLLLLAIDTVVTCPTPLPGYHPCMQQCGKLMNCSQRSLNAVPPQFAKVPVAGDTATNRFRTLLLANNNLTTLDEASFAALPALAEIDLSSNPIVYIPYEALSPLASLSALSVDLEAFVECPVRFCSKGFRWNGGLRCYGLPKDEFCAKYKSPASSSPTPNIQLHKPMIVARPGHVSSINLRVEAMGLATVRYVIARLDNMDIISKFGTALVQTNFAFVPIDHQLANFSISFTAIDSLGRTATVYLPIAMCSCNIACRFLSLSQVAKSNTTSLPCSQCPPGQTGASCRDIDECASSPCPQHTNCTELLPPAAGYTCSACLPGFVPETNATGTRCLNVDECSTDSHRCSSPASLCNDTIGSYTCTCAVGHTGTGGDDCVDINECDGGRSTCNQTSSVCLNTPGSFHCFCNSSNATGCSAFDLCTTNLHHCSSESRCVYQPSTAGLYSCVCNDSLLETQDGNCDSFLAIRSVDNSSGVQVTVKGNHVQLSCAVKGRIRGDVAWSADGLAIKSGLLFGIRSVTAPSGRMSTTITYSILDFTLDAVTAGQYTCRASNSRNIASATRRVNETLLTGSNAETMAVSGVTKTLTLLRILAIILFALLCSAVAGGLAVTQRRKQAVHYLSWSTGNGSCGQGKVLTRLSSSTSATTVVRHCSLPYTGQQLELQSRRPAQSGTLHHDALAEVVSQSPGRLADTHSRVSLSDNFDSQQLYANYDDTSMSSLAFMNTRCDHVATSSFTGSPAHTSPPRGRDKHSSEMEEPGCTQSRRQSTKTADTLNMDLDDVCRKLYEMEGRDMDTQYSLPSTSDISTSNNPHGLHHHARGRRASDLTSSNVRSTSGKEWAGSQLNTSLPRSRMIKNAYSTQIEGTYARFSKTRGIGSSISGMSILSDGHDSCLTHPIAGDVAAGSAECPVPDPPQSVAYWILEEQSKAAANSDTYCELEVNAKDYELSYSESQQGKAGAVENTKPSLELRKQSARSAEPDEYIELKETAQDYELVYSDLAQGNEGAIASPKSNLQLQKQALWADASDQYLELGTSAQDHELACGKTSECPSQLTQTYWEVEA